MIEAAVVVLVVAWAILHLAGRVRRLLDAARRPTGCGCATVGEGDGCGAARALARRIEDARPAGR